MMSLQQCWRQAPAGETYIQALMLVNTRPAEVPLSKYPYTSLTSDPASGGRKRTDFFPLQCVKKKKV